MILEEAAAWFDAAEGLALKVLQEDGIDADSLAESVRELDNGVIVDNGDGTPSLEGGEWGLRISGAGIDGLPHAVCHELVSFQVGAYSVWWTGGSEATDAMGLVSPDLPHPEAFAYLLAGTWHDQANGAVARKVPSDTAVDEEAM